MADPSVFDPIRIPFDYLVALDNRDFHFVFQRWHYLARMVHILSMSWFFGAVVMLDLQLIGLRRPLPASAQAAETRLLLDQWLAGLLPSLYLSFALAMVSGVLLFLHDPVHVGAHAYFAPKLILIAAGLLNAALYHRLGLEDARHGPASPPLRTRLAGAASLLLWSGVMICAALNVEGVPKVFLR